MGSQTDLSPFELGWLIGILEGEGTFQYNGNTQRVAIGMADEDTINKVACLLEQILGLEINIREQAGAKVHHSLIYYIDLNGDRARKIMRLVVRHMSFRRRQKIWQCLNKFKAPPQERINLIQLGLIKEAS